MATLKQDIWARVREIFEGAVERSPAERAAFLDESCNGDEAVRLEVESLLAAHEDSPSVSPTVDVPSLASNSPHDGAPEAQATGLGDQCGKWIGRYKLLERIGEGGFGAVYLAEQERPVRRRVALKIIKLGMDTRQVIARFEAERQALAMMEHPNIARVLDAGATEMGRPYFVM